VRAGLAFNPIQNATQALTAVTKLYWYIVLLNEATTITGFQVFCNTSSSDYLRVAVYRGALKTSGSGTITLCGQDVGGAPSVGGSYGGLEYCRRAFVVQSGQNLSFAAGEFITIGFHSTGSQNTFYASATTAATNTQHAYTSISNYANTSGFPASLTSSHISAVLANRVCFEFY
jgi:hypothetical protein